MQPTLLHAPAPLHAARTPGYVRQIACVDGERIYSAQELQAVQHKPDLSMSERWVRNSKSLVLCIAARRIGNALMVATGHSSGDITLRHVVENKDDDCEEEDDEVTLDVRLGGGAVRAFSMGERTLAAGTPTHTLTPHTLHDRCVATPYLPYLAYRSSLTT